MNAVLLTIFLCPSSHGMDLFQSDFIKHLWLHILPIILIGYEKVRFQRRWYDK